MIVGVDLETSEKAILISNKYEQVYATVGYPHESKEDHKDIYMNLKTLPKIRKL